MSVRMNDSAEHEACWSLRVFALLQDMAAQETNAVLTLLAEVDHLETACRYPDSGILFAGNRWRAFYHCHQAASMHAKEHGHFHLFTDIGNNAWAHVAGLSVDAEGQPLQWFMVNRWVTDGPWLESTAFPDQLEYVDADAEHEGLVESWLGALLQLYRDELSELLIKRDKQIKLYSKERCRQETMEEREVYLLATQAIVLQLKLEKYLLADPVLNNENAQQGV